MDTNSTTPPTEYPKNNKEILEMKVSIVIPVYNVEKFIEQSVNSVLNQEEKDLEIFNTSSGRHFGRNAI